MNTCPDCKNQFVQPFMCTTCGAQKLYDETVRSQGAAIERLQKKMLEDMSTIQSQGDEIQRIRQENERLRYNISQRLQELHDIRNDSLVWAMTCSCHCPACDAMYESIKGSVAHP